MMKNGIVVIGLGSMGKRRIRLLKSVDKNLEIIGIDGNVARQKEANELYEIKTFSSISEVEDNNDIRDAFVCTSPLSHNDIIRECLENYWNVFTELNLVSDGYKENMELAKRNGCVLFLSSTFFYREEIQYIRKYLTDKKNQNYIYHIGQYLPDWHPWEAYTDFFVGDKRTNGCREILAIELPWITKTFGEIKDFHVVSDKITALKIDYNDNYMIQFIHENGNKGILVVDVVSPVAVRKLEVYGEHSYIEWDASKVEIRYFDKAKEQVQLAELTEQVSREKGYGSFIVENAYTNEIQEFFDVVEGKKEAIYGFENDYQILKLIDRIEAV